MLNAVRNAFHFNSLTPSHLNTGTRKFCEEKFLLEMTCFFSTTSEKFTCSGEWTIKHVKIERVEKEYECCPHPFSDVSYTYTLERKSLYYVLYLIVPCIIISLLLLLNFCIPAESGERIGFCVTILLAMSVYLLLVAESLPETSEEVPLIGSYYIATMFEIALALGATAIILRCHHSNGDPPTWLIRFTKKIKRRRTNEVRVFVPPSEKEECQKEAGEPEKGQKNARDEVLVAMMRLLQEQREESASRDEWNEICQALDKLFLLLFTFMTIVITVGILVLARL